MKVSFSLFTTTAVAAATACSLLATVSADLVLNERILQLTHISAQLSKLAYQEDPPSTAYDTFGFFDDEPDQALVAKKMGYCFAAFRGTTIDKGLDDWRQNLKLGNRQVCSTGGDGGSTEKNNKNKNQQCCSTRTGFYEAYNTEYKHDMEVAIRACAKDCLNPDECVVLTGHSQGGAIAAVAALYLADLNPYVITFGQPPTVDQPCTLITSERYYRYINSKDAEKGVVGVSYDPVPFSPGLGADDFGHMLLLSSDSTGVAYIGLDAQDHFHPLDIVAAAHSMQAADADTPAGYLDRIESLLHTYGKKNHTYPVRSNGYVAGTLCSKNKECETDKCEKETTFSYSRCVGVECDENKDCDSDRCDSGLCLPKLSSCMSCNEDSDCAGNKCLQYRCSGSNGLMDDNCNCNFDGDCDSGRCEGLAPPVCEAKLGVGGRCNEDTDCRSDYCSWRFRCDNKLQNGEYCTEHADCESDHCSWRFRCSTPRFKSPWMTASVVPETTARVVATESEPSSVHFGMVLAGFLFVANAALVAYKRVQSRRRHGGYEEVPTSLTV